MKQSKALKEVSRVCWRLLGLSLPYRVNVRDVVKIGKTRVVGCYQFCEGNRRLGPYHRISISTIARFNRGFYNVLAHEFVHAWQIENGFILENHDAQFVEVARILEKELGKILKRKLDLYCPTTDKA